MSGSFHALSSTADKVRSPETVWVANPAGPLDTTTSQTELKQRLEDLQLEHLHLLQQIRKLQDSLHEKNCKQSAAPERLAGGGGFRGGIPSCPSDAFLKGRQTDSKDDWERMRGLLLKLRREHLKVQEYRVTLQQEVDRLREDLSTALQANGDLRAEVSAAENRAESQIRDLREKQKEIRATFAEKQEELEAVDVLVASKSKQVTEASARLDDLRPKLSAALEARSNVAFLLAELRANSNDARKAELEALRSRVDSIETELSRLRGLDASSERRLLLDAR
jgi:predicted  nucleic acid-binding Zn-ribbon protein